jgi:PAS domain S-box-containing protein
MWRLVRSTGRFAVVRIRRESVRDEPAFDAGWRAVLDAVPALVYVLAPNGSVTFVNRYFCEYTGLTRAALLADSWAQVIHPEDLPNAAASLASGLAARSTFTVRQRIRGGDGSYRYYDALTVPHCDARGRITQWFGVESDVEDLLRTIEALEEAERGQRTVLDSIPIIVWTADPAGQLEWCNSKWSEFTGEPSANVLDWGWRRAHHPLEVERTTAAWLRSIRTGETFEMEVRLRRHDGAFRWMLTRGVPVRDAAGHIVRWYGSTMEIEAQKQLEARSSRAASLLQAALLPEKLPSIPGVELDALYLPAESNALVGGDWYDAVALGNGRILLSCGDVTGHGLAAARRSRHGCARSSLLLAVKTPIRRESWRA